MVWQGILYKKMVSTEVLRNDEEDETMTEINRIAEVLRG